MHLVSKVVAAMALELSCAAALWSVAALVLWRSRARRRWRALAVDAARGLRRLAPIAALALGAAVAVGVAATGTFAPAAHLGIWPSTALFFLAGALPASGCWLLLRASVREARGRVRKARRETRLGGFVVLAGGFAQLFVVWGDLLFRLDWRRAIVLESHPAGLALVAGMLLCGLAAFTATLAGLTGKPRPGGMWATLFYVGALTAFVAAADRTGQPAFSAVNSNRWQPTSNGLPSMPPSSDTVWRPTASSIRDSSATV
jgi:hypothetical protein